MRMTGSMKRVMVLFGAADRFGHHALSAELLERAHAAGLAGATVLPGTAGFGASRTVHTAHVLSLSDDLPMMFLAVDTPAKVDGFLASLDVVTSGLVLVEDVEAV